MKYEWTCPKCDIFYILDFEPNGFTVHGTCLERQRANRAYEAAIAVGMLGAEASQEWEDAYADKDHMPLA